MLQQYENLLISGVKHYNLESKKFNFNLIVLMEFYTFCQFRNSETKFSENLQMQ